MKRIDNMAQVPNLGKVLLLQVTVVDRVQFFFNFMQFSGEND